MKNMRTTFNEMAKIITIAILDTHDEHGRAKVEELADILREAARNWEMRAEGYYQEHLCDAKTYRRILHDAEAAETVAKLLEERVNK